MDLRHPNAADRSQVKHAARKEREAEARVGANLKAVMSTVSGRAAMWDLLERFGVFRSVWANSAMIHYNAGRQDCGHELMALLLAADEGGYLRMEQEAREVGRRDKVEREAVRTPTASEQGGNEHG